MPVDVATGSVHLELDDVAVAGKVELRWPRRYSTGLRAVQTALGRSWTSVFFAQLRRRDGEFEFIRPDGSVEVFRDPDRTIDAGEVVRLPGAYLELFRDGERHVVQQWDVRTAAVTRYVFRRGTAGAFLPLASIEDPTGQALDLSWDPEGRLLQVQQRLERRALVPAYTPAGLISRVVLRAATGKHAPVVEYEYDPLGRLAAARDAAGFADRYEYDAAGRLQREIARDGGVFTYRYDPAGRCVRTAGLDRYQEKRLRFLDAARATEVTDSYGRTVRYFHLPSGQITREVDPAGGETISEYDEHGRLAAKTDALGGRTHYEYDEAGNRVAVTNALGHTHRFVFDARRLPVAMTGPSGQVWRREYDERGRLTRTVDPLGGEWRFEHDADGNISSVRDPLGARKEQRHAGGVLAAVTDWRGHVTRVESDAFGRPVRRIGPRGETIDFRYDVVGHLVGVRLPDGAEIRATYDAAGNMTSVTSGTGHTTRLQYTTCRRLIRRVDPAGRAVQFVWGTEPGRLECVINENGERHEFRRDDAGRIVGERSFSGAERRFRYDAAGYPVELTNGTGETVTITRDPLHRVSRQQLADGTSVTYAYDAAGRLTTATSGDSTVTLTRDELGRIVRETQGDHWVASRYDALGRVTGTETSLGHRVHFTLEANGHVAGLELPDGWAARIERDPYGRERSRSVPDAVRLEQTHDLLGRLVAQRLGFARADDGNGGTAHIPAPAHVLSRSYTYNRDGSLVSLVDGRGERQDFTYDPADRLLEVSGVRLRESFSYDPAGNATAMVADAGDRVSEDLEYGPGGRLLRKGSTRYEYDAEGRRTAAIERDGTGTERRWTYAWDALNRLRAVTRPDGGVWRYDYDAFDRRVAARAPGASCRFVWDKDVVIHEVDGAGAASAWIYDPWSFVPIVSVQQGKRYSVVTDHLGTPRELIDHLGRIAWSQTTTAWGMAREHGNGEVGCPLRFPGQRRDAETGLHYNRFRYYDPAAGVYLTEDPIGLLGGLSLYRYGNPPTKRIDPFGLCDEPDLPPNTLTREEAAELQALADRFNTNIDVIGSRAEGRGRNIDQPDLPVGKGEGTRSDIDVRIDGQVDINTRGGLSSAVGNVGNGAGSVASSTGLPSSPPAILFRPGQPPVVKR